MESDRRQLVEMLETHYRRGGWTVKRSDDGTLYANGPGGVTWIGAAIVPADLEDEGIADRLLQMSEQRMEGGGELCPLELLPSPDCAEELKTLLARIGIADRSNVGVYSLAS
jgi:hypothetical protein